MAEDTVASWDALTGQEARGLVARIEGLRPRRGPGDGGEVPSADVDVVEGLVPAAAGVAAAWLRERPSPALRRTRLRVLASYLRWLRAQDLAGDVLGSGSQVDAYCLAALTTGLAPSGRPLAKATVVRRRAVLASFYAFAGRHGRALPAPAAHPPTPAERRLLRGGIATLAEEGRLAEAVAVGLLESTGASVDALARLTACDVHLVGGGDPVLITLHDGRGDIVAFPLAPYLRRPLRRLCGDRPADHPLLSGDAGRRVDLAWTRAALIDAALAAGLPRWRAEGLHPHLMRALTVTELGGSPADVRAR
ncbi:MULTISPECIES: hypothetical protein [unclassified Nonomuraea]|uniref:hypothetical protein n=1 Tax=Nonomuraea sp. NPDC047529 TaxID=3155623 RepID=UPI0033E24469